jgi:hypothetical protein
MTASGTQHHVTYDAREPDPDAEPIYRGHVERSGLVTLYPSPGRWRRRRYEVWYDDDGRKMGRWQWEYFTGT